MIQFDWKGNKQHIEYYVNWNLEEDSYSVLYLHYENISKIKKIEKGNLKILDGTETGVIPIYPSRQCFYKRLPQMPSATYRFMLYDNLEKRGSCLAVKEMYVGAKIELYREEKPLGNGFAQMKLSCQYKLPQEQYGFMVKAMPEEQFWLPVMQKQEDYYETSCVIVEGASKHVDIFLGTKIRDFVEIVEKEEA